MIPARTTVTRNTRRAELALDVPAAAQVGGEFVLVTPEPAEIDDTGQSGCPRAHRKHGRAVAVPALEVRGPQRMHQVASSLATGHGDSQTGTVLDVAQDRRTRSSITSRVASHGDHVVSRGLQNRAQPPADEPGRSGNEHPHRRTRFGSSARPIPGPAAQTASGPRSNPRLDGTVMAGRRWDTRFHMEVLPRASGPSRQRSGGRSHTGSAVGERR